MYNASQLAFDLTEHGLIPDIVIRRGIRHLLRQRLREIRDHDTESTARIQHEFIREISRAPLALVPEKANEQHYEVPASFYQRVLGPHLKYSCGYWPQHVSTLAGAEQAALEQTCAHARIADGQTILELGCGWGSLSLWLARRYPESRITAVSNSHSQRAHIETSARAQGLDNLDVITCDINTLELESGKFDRVVSVEMFEHMRNWPALYRRIAGWLKPGGLFFKHIFVHRNVPYLFEDNGPSDWMSRHFFTGGMMPSDDLPLMFQHDLQFVQRWRWDGSHYEKTANAWLANMDAQQDVIEKLFATIYGEQARQTWWVRWRLFFMACAELFGHDNGQRWWVSHYLFEKPAA